MSQDPRPSPDTTRHDELPDGELLTRAGNNPVLFGVFYERHSEAVFSFLSRRARDTHDALDLLSAVFEVALKNRRRYRPEEGPARAWLFGIANKLLLADREKLRKERAKRWKLGVPRMEFTDQALEEAEDRIDASESGLLRGLEGLSEPEREAVRARIIDEHSYADIALAHGVSEAAIRQRVSRGLDKLTRLARGGDR